MLLLWDPALLCTYPAAKPYPPSHLSNTTYLIRLMNFGGVSVGLAALLCGDSVTTDYILGGGMWAAGRPVLVAPLTDRGVTVWGGILSQVLLLLNSSNANTHRQARCTSKHTNSYPKLQIFDLAKKKKKEAHWIKHDWLWHGGGIAQTRGRKAHGDKWAGWPRLALS